MVSCQLLLQIGRGDRFWKWQDFQLWRARDLDLDLGSGHTAHHRASLIDQISLKSKQLFVDGRMDGYKDGHLRPALLGRLCRRVDLKTWLYISAVWLKTSISTISTYLYHPISWKLLSGRDSWIKKWCAEQASGTTAERLKSSTRHNWAEKNGNKLIKHFYQLKLII